MNAAVGGFFRGQLVVALIVGTMASIGLLIIGLPFWLLIGMVAGLFNMIPLIGPYIGGIPALVIALTTKEPITAAVGGRWSWCRSSRSTTTSSRRWSCSGW